MSLAGFTTFRADRSEIAVRRREGGMVLAVAILLLLPALGSFLWGLLNLPFDVAYSSSMFQQGFIFLFLPGLGGVVFGARALQVMRGRTVVVELEPDALRVPEPGTRNAVFPGLEDGFRYAYRKRVLAVRVPYGRIAAVRRVVDADEKHALMVPHPHRTVRTRGLNGLDVRARGYAWIGSDSNEQAPMLVVAEFGRCWVRDLDKVVAITLQGVRQDGQVHPAVPEVVDEVTLYVSVEQPDRLVGALQQRCQHAPGVPLPQGEVGSLPPLASVRPP